jgi:hypothetical protein
VRYTVRDRDNRCRPESIYQGAVKQAVSLHIACEHTSAPMLWSTHLHHVLTVLQAACPVIHLAPAAAANRSSSHQGHDHNTHAGSQHTVDRVANHKEPTAAVSLLNVTPVIIGYPKVLCVCFRSTSECYCTVHGSCSLCWVTEDVIDALQGLELGSRLLHTTAQHSTSSQCCCGTAQHGARHSMTHHSTTTAQHATAQRSIAQRGIVCNARAAGSAVGPVVPGAQHYLSKAQLHVRQQSSMGHMI